MEPTPQQVKEDILVGSLKPPPSNLKVAGCRYSLLENLVVLGNVPITKIVVRDVGLVHQDQGHQLPIGLASTN